MRSPVSERQKEKILPLSRMQCCNATARQSSTSGRVLDLDLITLSFEDNQAAPSLLSTRRSKS